MACSLNVFPFVFYFFSTISSKLSAIPSILPFLIAKKKVNWLHEMMSEGASFWEEFIVNNSKATEGVSFGR